MQVEGGRYSNTHVKVLTKVDGEIDFQRALSYSGVFDRLWLSEEFTVLDRTVSRIKLVSSRSRVVNHS